MIDVASVTQLMSAGADARAAAGDRAQPADCKRRREYQSITGNRGMQLLLAGTVRNYLPPRLDASCRRCSTQRTEAIAALAAMCQAALRCQRGAVAAAAGSAAAGAQRSSVQAGRQSAALLQAVSQEALANTALASRPCSSSSTRSARANDQKAHARSAGADQCGAGHAAERADQAAGALPGRSGRAMGERAARARADRLRATGSSPPASSRPLIRRHGESPWASLQTFWSWLNGQLAELHRRQHRARGRGAGAGDRDAGDAVRHGLGLPAADRSHRGAVGRRAQAHRDAGGGPGVALHLWLYNSVIVDTFYHAPAQLAAAVVGAADPVTTIDAIWSRAERWPDCSVEQGRRAQR